MKFTVTKQWKELPFKTITIITSLNDAFRLDTGANAPTGEGVAYRGVEIQKLAEDKIWIKLSAENLNSSVEVEIANFI